MPDSRLFSTWSGGVDDDNIGPPGVEGGGGVVDEGGAVQDNVRGKIFSNGFGGGGGGGGIEDRG